MDAEGQGARKWGDEVASAVLLERDDGLPTRAGVAAESEDRHAGIDARGDEVRLVGVDLECRSAGIAPPGRRRTAASAFEREDEVEHGFSVAVAVGVAGVLSTEVAGTIGFVEANGLTFAYIEEGSGPLVLMLHGFPDTAHTWDDLRPRIADRGYRAVSPFMRGYHPTAVPSADPDQETLASDALALITALGASEAVLIGHDWGASAVYGAAALRPDRVSKLMAVAIPHPATLRPSLRKVWGVRHFGLYKLPLAAQRFARNDFEALPAIYRRWSPTWTPHAAEFDAVRECLSSPGSLDAAFGYYRKLSPLPSASLRTKITVPTVAIAGSDDPLAEPSDFRRAARMFKGEYILEEVPGGHFMHREHPKEFAARVLGHL